MRTTIVLLLSVLVAATTGLCGAAGEAGAPERVDYARPFEPPTRSAFIPLRPSTIEPAGWPRDCYLAARDGFTGHMHVIEKQFPLP